MVHYSILQMVRQLRCSVLGPPQIKRFDAAHKDHPEDYAGDRSVESFIEFLTGEEEAYDDDDFDEKPAAKDEL